MLADVWTHGDFVAIHPITKQLVFHGRADGVLNPSGVRFGSAEIYRVIEGKFTQEIADFQLGKGLINNTSQYINIVPASTSYKPLALAATSNTTAWGLEGDTLITTTGSSFGRREAALQ